MYFDYSSKKIFFLASLVLVLACSVSLTLSLLVKNETRLRELSYFALRTKSELSYLALFKSSEGLTASAQTALPHTAVQKVTTDAKSVPVLLYHGEGGDAASMSIATFVDQMKSLKAAGWKTITLAQFEGFMQGTMTVPDKSFLLTFDDGRRDTFYASDPVLHDLGYTAVMYVITGLSLPENKDMAVNNFYLSKSELAYMAKSGRWELESHGDQDHSGYAVPSSLTATSSMLQSQHFLSNRFWLPGKERVETVQEYTERIKNDLARSKNLLEQNFGRTVTSYAYPFNDFGEDSANFPESMAVIKSAVSAIYQYAFYQTWEGNGDSFNHPNPGLFMVKRIEPLSSWTGNDLLSLLENARAKSLPYGAFSFLSGWQTNWGTVTPGPTLALAASADTTGAAAFLDGTEAWTDYRISTSADITEGTFSLIARHTEADAPYLVCAFSDDRIYLEEHSGETQRTLAVANYYPGSGLRNSTMTVQGATASCSSGGVTVTHVTMGIPSHGGVGVTVWHPQTGAAEAMITRFSVASVP